MAVAVTTVVVDRRGGRKHPKPRPGDVVAGTWLVVADLGGGRLGHEQRSFRVECVGCGVTLDLFEYSLRVRKPCHHGRRRKPRPPRKYRRFSSVAEARCGACPLGKSRIALRDGLCALHLQQRAAADATSTGAATCGARGTPPPGR